jgi:hypothetical protein
VAKRLLQVLLVWAIALPCVASELAIAGRGATLEQAVSAPHANNYRLLIVGKELQRIKTSEADEDVRALIDQVRRTGGVVFACEKDLHRRHLDRADLLPGVLAVDASDVWEHGAPSEADRMLRSICS